MKHKKVVHIKAEIKPQMPTTSDMGSLSKETDKKDMQSVTQPMYIYTDIICIYVNIHSINQCCQYEVATENVERALFETYGVSSLEIYSDIAYTIPEFGRCIYLKISFRHLHILLEEYAKKYYSFDYDVIFNHGTPEDVSDLDNDKYDTVVKIDRRVVGEEAFKAIARMYIGKDVDISDIGYIQIQAPVVEYGR